MASSSSPTPALLSAPTSLLPPHSPSHRNAVAAAWPNRAQIRLRATTGDHDAAAAATTTEEDMAKRKQRKRCLRCGALYLDVDNSPAACAFHGHITGRYSIYQYHCTTRIISSGHLISWDRSTQFCETDAHLSVDAFCRREGVVLAVSAAPGDRRRVERQERGHRVQVERPWQPAQHRPRKLEGEVELLPGARRGRAALPPRVPRLLRRRLHSLLVPVSAPSE